MAKEAPGGADEAAWAAKVRLADALRELGEALPWTALGEQEILAAADSVGEWARRLAARRRDRSEQTLRVTSGVEIPAMSDFRLRGPIAGRANPVAPPVHFRTDTEQRLVEGEVSYGPLFEGAPGIVHGGLLAAALDEALGMACTFVGELCMTGEVTFRYHRPTPTLTPLRIVARPDAREGRRIAVSGEILADGAVTVASTATFISVEPGLFGDFDLQRAEREDGA